MALLLLQALSASGNEVFVASRFRSWDPTGDPRRQRRLQRVGARISNRLMHRMRRSSPATRPDVWLTYHVYHKAPDWIGPTVATKLDIPYVVVEASHAARQKNGPWSVGYRAASDSIRRADCVVVLNSNDLPGIRELRTQRVVHLKPFLDLPASPSPVSRAGLKEHLSREHGVEPGSAWLIAVAMMRERSKLESYRLLAKSLERVARSRWSLILIGDGPARNEVVRAFSEFSSDRVHFTGELEQSRISEWLTASDLFVWPAVNEAYGMALLEAQACGLPAVAGRVGGVGDIVVHGETGLLVEQDAGAFARAVGTMLTDPELRIRMGIRARRKVECEHNFSSAKASLHELLNLAVAQRTDKSPRTSSEKRSHRG